MTPLTTKETVELIISNNCFDCEQFWAPLATSECLCMPIEEMMSKQDEIEEWERQQKELTGE